MSRGCVSVVCLLLAGGLVTPCSAKSIGLPSFSNVQARFVHVLGGYAAVTRFKTSTTHGEYIFYHRGRVSRVIPFVTYLGDFKRLEIDTGPNGKRYMSGYDGTTAWQLNPGNKAQIFSGGDALSARRDADLYYWSRIASYFRSLSVVGIEPFAGHTCYHARGMNLWGNVNNQYYDVRSGLLIGYRFHQWMGSGPEKAETRQIFDRYTPTDGLLVPMRVTNYRDGKLQLVARNLSVEFNNVDPRMFETPPAVRAALAKRQARR